MSTLYIMCGAPGSGKDYYIKHHIKHDEIAVSRDEVRFSMVPEGDEYFSKEDEVFKEYCDEISVDSIVYNGVYANATHLNDKSRWKLLNEINLNGFHKIVFICIEAPINTVLSQNAKRTGRAFVPEAQVRKMYRAYKRPVAEKFERNLGIPVEVKMVRHG